MSTIANKHLKFGAIVPYKTKGSSIITNERLSEVFDKGIELKQRGDNFVLEHTFDKASDGVTRHHKRQLILTDGVDIKAAEQVIAAINTNPNNVTVVKPPRSATEQTGYILTNWHKLVIDIAARYAFLDTKLGQAYLNATGNNGPQFNLLNLAKLLTRTPQDTKGNPNHHHFKDTGLTQQLFVSNFNL